mmetsp:Transcript_90044/g.125081  ORF Transcript_90044/g.125081 Transcript_90044/m.125081 type:complete len:167 (+) Transcript_90044:181-681(+)
MGGEVMYNELQVADGGSPAESPTDDKDLYRYAGKELGRVKRHLVNGGFDNKFDDDGPPPKGVAGVLPYREYKQLLRDLNAILSKNRTKTGDIVGLFSLMILYMPVFVVRRKARSKRRRKGLAGVLDDFNEGHPKILVWLDRSAGDLVFSEAVISLEAPAEGALEEG